MTWGDRNSEAGRLRPRSIGARPPGSDFMDAPKCIQCPPRIRTYASTRRIISSAAQQRYDWIIADRAGPATYHVVRGGNLGSAASARPRCHLQPGAWQTDGWTSYLDLLAGRPDQLAGQLSSAGGGLPAPLEPWSARDERVRASQIAIGLSTRGRLGTRWAFLRLRRGRGWPRGYQVRTLALPQPPSGFRVDLAESPSAGRCSLLKPH